MSDLEIDVPPKPRVGTRSRSGARHRTTPVYLQQAATVGKVDAPGWPAILEEARLHLARILHLARSTNDAETLSRTIGGVCRAAASLAALEKLAAADLADLSDEELRALVKGAIK